MLGTASLTVMVNGRLRQSLSQDSQIRLTSIVSPWASSHSPVNETDCWEPRSRPETIEAQPTLQVDQRGFGHVGIHQRVVPRILLGSLAGDAAALALIRAQRRPRPHRRLIEPGTRLADSLVLGISGTQFDTNAAGAIHFEPGGVFFWD